MASPRGNGASLPARLTSLHLPSPVTLDGSLRVECDVKFAVADTAEREICSAVSQWRVFLSTGFFLPLMLMHFLKSGLEASTGLQSASRPSWRVTARKASKSSPKSGSFVA